MKIVTERCYFCTMYEVQNAGNAKAFRILFDNEPHEYASHRFVVGRIQCHC